MRHKKVEKRKIDPDKIYHNVLVARFINRMIKDGKKVFGLEFEGKWLECGNKLAYLKSNIYLSLQDPRFKEELKKFLAEEL